MLLPVMENAIDGIFDFLACKQGRQTKREELDRCFFFKTLTGHEDTPGK